MNKRNKLERRELMWATWKIPGRPLFVWGTMQQANDSQANLPTERDQPHEGPTRIYLSRLVELLSGVADPDAVYAAVRQARGFAGGKRKAEKIQQDKQYAEKLNAEQNAPPITTDRFDDPDPDLDLDLEIINNQEEAVETTEEETMHDMHDLAASDIEADKTALNFYTEIPVEQYAEAAPDAIPLLPQPGIYHHPRYGDIVITRERNRRFVEHINTGVYQKYIPIDAEHQTKLSGAFGWITGASLNQDGSADAQVEWTDRGKSVLTEKRFRYISPEWMLRYQDPGSGEVYEDVVVAAALTTRPFFKEPALRAIVATERGIWDASEVKDGQGNPMIILQMCDVAETSTHDERSTSVPEERNQSDVPVDEQVQQQASEEPVTDEVIQETVEPEAPKQATEAQPEPVVPEQLISSTEVEQLPEEVVHAFNEMRSMVEHANQLVEAKDKEAQEFRQMLEQSNERIKAMEDDARIKRFTEMVTGRNGEDDGAQWYGEPDKHVSMLKSLADAFGEDSEQFQIYVENQRAVAAQQAESQLYREIGNQYQNSGATSSAWQQIEAKANEYRQNFNDRKLTMQQAITAVTEEHPELHEAYLAERGMK